MAKREGAATPQQQRDGAEMQNPQGWATQRRFSGGPPVNAGNIYPNRVTDRTLDSSRCYWSFLVQARLMIQYRHIRLLAVLSPMCFLAESTITASTCE